MEQLGSLDYEIVNLGRDYHGKITNFAEARNSFLRREQMGDPLWKWILFLSDDEEPSRMLLDYIRDLKPTEPYYWIRRINLFDGHYAIGYNPEYSPQLVSSKVHFVGRLHEHVEPRKPHGVIDYPIIHDHRGGWSYDSGWKGTPAYRMVQAFKLSLQTLRGR